MDVAPWCYKWDRMGWETNEYWLNKRINASCDQRENASFCLQVRRRPSPPIIVIIFIIFMTMTMMMIVNMMMMMIIMMMTMIIFLICDRPRPTCQVAVSRCFAPTNLPPSFNTTTIPDRHLSHDHDVEVDHDHHAWDGHLLLFQRNRLFIKKESQIFTLLVNLPIIVLVMNWKTFGKKFTLVLWRVFTHLLHYQHCSVYLSCFFLIFVLHFCMVFSLLSVFH